LVSLNAKVGVLGHRATAVGCRMAVGGRI